MMNDSVRAELLAKISTSKPLKRIENGEVSQSSNASGELALPPVSLSEKTKQSTPVISEAPKNVPITFEKSTTSNLGSKQTSPTLVEFHSKNSTVPEWRLQLQNVVRQRADRETRQPEKAIVAAAAAAPTRHSKLVTSGSNALKIDAVAEKLPARQKNPTLSSALARIEKSRQKFLIDEAGQELPVATVAAPRPANKNFPFYIASKQPGAEVETAEPNASPSLVDKSAVAVPVKIESGQLNTNKLPPLPLAPAKIQNNFAETVGAARIVETKPVEKVQPREAKIEYTESREILETGEVFEDCEDRAPFAMRFNAGLFDLIIGGFTSLFLLAPFMMSGGDWFTFTGFLAFLATCSIVMFIYLTTTIGFYGRTFGMRIFSLEVVDVNGENYPTLHQAAVSSAVYILSLVFGGAGFLTMFFNHEKRAAHDLISGTMVVKEN